MENIILAGTETIIEEVKVLTRILNEFSRFARLPEMKGEFQNINMVITNCVNIFLGHEGISFHLDLDNSIPDLFIDKILIRQALTNILQNSIDAVGTKGNIHIKSESIDTQQGKIVRISIRDDGTGIEASNILQVFDPAFSTKDSGTGLGLAIVEKIVLEHSGRVFCNPLYQDGAEFVIEFPIPNGEEESGKDTIS